MTPQGFEAVREALGEQEFITPIPLEDEDPRFVHIEQSTTPAVVKLNRLAAAGLMEQHERLSTEFKPQPSFRVLSIVHEGIYLEDTNSYLYFADD